MAQDDDLGEALIADARRRRWRLLGFVVATIGVALVASVVVLSLRERRVHLVGGAETVTARVEGVTRFRLVAPFGATVWASPGEHTIVGERGSARSSLRVPWAPWTSQVAAPVEEGQCLIVASGGGFYQGGEPERLVIHEVTHETRDVALPVMTDVVARHPCQLPPSIRLLDTIVVITTVPCAEAPATDG